MRIVIASDLHGNQEALAVLPREYDELWILGDLVNFGPDPGKVVEFVRERAVHVVRGNHDHAAGYGESPRCYGRFQELAEATGKVTEQQLSETDRRYLRGLPLQIHVQKNQTQFWLCHATPSDPLFGYAPPRSDVWGEECCLPPADILLVGHTHGQFMRKIGDCLVVNPGSLGLPNNRSSLACFAVWEDGIMSLRSTLYDVERTVGKVQAMPVSLDVQVDLVTLLRTGQVADVNLRRTEGVYSRG